MSHPDPKALTLPTPKRSNATRLFGYDVFISFALGAAPRGTRGYSSDLARRLRELDFTVFFSEDEAAAGSELDSTLKRALLRSRILVVIANRATLERPGWVRTEVEEFRARHPDRAVIPISIEGALLDTEFGAAANDWLQFKDKIWIDESAAAVQAATVSSEVLARLATAPTSSRANLRWRRVVIGVGTALVTLTIGLALAWSVAVRNEARARAELVRATALRLAGEAQVAMAAGSAGNDERAIQQVLAAHRLHPSAEVDSALLTFLNERRALLKLIPVGTAIAAVAFHPDGHRLAAGTLELAANGDNSLRLWKIEDGREAGPPFPRLAQPYLSVAFSSDGAITATGNGDTKLRFWDTETRKLLGEPVSASVSETVNSVVFDPDGSGLVSGSNDGLLVAWDVASRAPAAGPLNVGKWAILSLALSRDGRVATAGSDGHVRVWERRSLKPLSTRPMRHQGAVYGLAFSPDDQTLASAGADNVIRTWDARTGMPVGDDGMRHDAAIKGLAFSPDGRTLASVGDDRTVRLWDLQSRRLITEPLVGHSRSIGAVAFSRNGLSVATGSEDGTLRLWSAGGATPLGRILMEELRPMALAYSADGRLVVAQEDGWTVEADRQSRRRVTASSAAESSRSEHGKRTFSANGRRIAVAAGQDKIRVFDVTSGQVVGAPIPTGRGVRALALSADGTLLAIADADRAIKLWDLATGQPLGQNLKGHADDVTTLAFSPDGRRLASGAGGYWSSDNTVRLWDVRTQLQVGRPLVGHRSAVRALAFRPDGRTIVSAGGDKERNDYSLRQWDVETGRPLGAPMEGHATTVLALAFSADGRLILSGGSEGRLRVWVAATGQPAGPPMPSLDKSITHIAVSPDNWQIVTAGAGDRLLVWPGPAAWASELCRKLTRNMSQEEWRNWVSPEVDYVCQCEGLPLSSSASGAPPGVTVCKSPP